MKHTTKNGIHLNLADDRGCVMLNLKDIFIHLRVRSMARKEGYQVSPVAVAAKHQDAGEAFNALVVVCQEVAMDVDLLTRWCCAD